MWGLPSKYAHTCFDLQRALSRLRKKFALSHPESRPPLDRLVAGVTCCVEAFAGTGGLSAALRDSGFRVDEPLEAYPRPGVHVACKDLLNPQVLRTLHLRILSGDIGYMHFGLPCKTWGPLARMNGSSRSQSHPGGFPPSLKDLLGNEEAKVVAGLCRSLSSVGAFWSIENPKGSYCFLYAPVRDLLLLPSVIDVSFDQCMYGLCPPTPEGFTSARIRKGTCIRSNIAGFKNLAFKCDHSHVHTWAIGSVLVNSSRVSLSASAGAYPKALCRAMAQGLLAA